MYYIEEYRGPEDLLCIHGGVEPTFTTTSDTGDNEQYITLWNKVEAEYPTLISIAFIGDYMLINTEQEVQGKVPDTRSYLRDLIQNLDNRIKESTSVLESTVLSMRRDMLAGLL